MARKRQISTPGAGRLFISGASTDLAIAIASSEAALHFHVYTHGPTFLSLMTANVSTI